MEGDRGADVDNEQVDSVLGDHVDRQVVVGTLPLPAVTIIPINISNAKLMDVIYIVCCSSAPEEENIWLVLRNPELEESAWG